MARDTDSNSDRRRRREEEDAGIDPSSSSSSGHVNSSDAELAKLHELMDRAGPAIEQLNNLYNQYFAGAERRPPLERRQQLDQLMEMIRMLGKPTQAIRFKCNSLQSHYVSNRDRWDRLLKEQEAGRGRWR